MVGLYKVLQEVRIKLKARINKNLVFMILTLSKNNKNYPHTKNRFNPKDYP